jgi:hypothetical protein
MSGQLAILASSIVLTHAVRVATRLAGPRRGALALGLPSTTALALVGCGLEGGSDDAAVMAEACLLGLVAATVLPLAYARVADLRRRPAWAVAAAVASYLLVAGCLGQVPSPGPVGCLGLATAAVLMACHLTQRPPGGDDPPSRPAPSAIRALLLRTSTPAACLLAVTALRDAAGPRWAGLLGPFPGLTLAALVTAHLESGPAEAARMARALPPGNLGTVAFLAAFRFVGPQAGMVQGVMSGYAAALATLVAVDAMAVLSGHDAQAGDPYTSPAVRRDVAASGISSPRVPLRGRRSGHRGAFLPLVEPIVF